MAVVILFNILMSFSFGLAFGAGTYGDPLHIHRPSVDVVAQQTGNMTLLSGYNGNIKILPGANESGTVYFDGEDLLHFIQIISSLPPVWANHSPFGYIGEYHSGQRINVQLNAEDPEGTTISYSLVGGNLPPGVKLNPSNGLINGIAPNTDEMYTFTIRASDMHGKYADNVFKLWVRGSELCSSNPCLHEARCEEKDDRYICHCVHPYGGRTCNLDCRSNSLGVVNNKKWIPDAQMTAYKSSGSYQASWGRLNGGNFWRGVDRSSWLQVDLGNKTRVFGTIMQYYSSSYYTNSYMLQYSLDGNTFHNYTSANGHVTTFSAGASTYTRPLPDPVDARFVRFIGLGWYSSHGPSMKVDILGCHYYNM